MTFAVRLTGCVVSWAVVEERTLESGQQLLDGAVPAQQYRSDQFPSYAQLLYGQGQTHQALPDESQTYSVAGVNADLRHYLAHLRRRSHCFFRCLTALRRAVKLFVYPYNQRQLYHWRFPTYPPFPWTSAFP